MMRRAAFSLAVLPMVFAFALIASAQAPPVPSIPAPAKLDPTRNITNPQLFSSFHQPLPEQYIWTKDAEHQSREQRDQARYFRAHFRVEDASTPAMLYLAGPRGAEVYVNGKRAAHLEADPLSRLQMQVLVADITSLQRAGDNVLAIAADHGERMVAKILPAPPGILAPPILISDGSWKATTKLADGWQNAAFDDHDWPAADAMGSIEGNIDFFQWNRDAGLYQWPQYEGVSPFLAHTYVPPEGVRDVYAADGSFENVDALTTTSEDPAHEFSVHFAAHSFSQFHPSITLDFGREVTGRIQIVSATDSPITVSVAYGESVEEAHDEPYLGVDVLHDPPNGTAVGPKSAFRYAQIRFLAGPPVVMFRAIRVEDIYYPVHYEGAFASSDPLLNQIWATGAYTSHLCMQDDIWDAPKRDRGRWMGDTDVSGRVIDDVFADHFLLEDTMTRLIGPMPIRGHVNGIPGYSSYWVTELAHYVRHTGGLDYARKMHDQLVGLLQFMDKDFNAQNQFINHTHEWLFVDWAIGLNGYGEESQQATALEYVRAYREGAWILRQLGDTGNADHFAQRADAIAKASTASEFANGSFGPRWQTNAMAVISGTAEPDQYATIWSHVLANVGKPTYRLDITTPYYGAYILDAMAEMHHRAEALAWIREYWGGMIHEGATSFWEAYDPGWPKRDFHVDLQADDTAGYRISLAHGWSSGPTFWLMEQVLGIRPTGPGFSQTTIRPDLVDLEWARGGEPTPNGMLQVDLKKAGQGLEASFEIPAGVEATVLFPVRPGVDHVQVNGQSETGTPEENGTRLAVVLKAAGKYEVRNSD
jgi:alpha-L-rhamnosidase